MFCCLFRYVRIESTGAVRSVQVSRGRRRRPSGLAGRRQAVRVDQAYDAVRARPTRRQKIRRHLSVLHVAGKVSQIIFAISPVWL